MRSNVINGTRTEWYDRSIAAVGSSYNDAAVAPHALTTKLSYTVPANVTLRLSEVWIDIFRSAAASSVGPVYVYLTVYNAGSFGVAQYDFTMEDNTVGARFHIRKFQGLILPTGYKVETKTYDGSTGGTVDYGMGLIGNTYTP